MAVDYRRDSKGVRKYINGKPTNDVRRAEDDFPQVRLTGIEKARSVGGKAYAYGKDLVKKIAKYHKNRKGLK